jgi:hypothetical protein
MSGTDFDVGALGEAVVFLEYFRDLPDVRQSAKVMYPLDEVLLLSLLAVLAGAETFVDIARFGGKKQAFLRRFRPFLAGTPSHDHLRDARCGTVLRVVLSPGYRHSRVSPGKDSIRLRRKIGSVRDVLQNRLRSEAVMAGW